MYYGRGHKSVQDFVNIVESVAVPLFKKQNSHQTKVNVFDNKSENPLYDEDCRVQHYAFMQNLNLFRECKSVENRIKMVKSRSEYKRIIRSSKLKFDNARTTKLEENRYKNTKQYWNMLKKASGLKTSSIGITEFERYFKSVSNPDDPFFTPDEDILYFNERYLHNEFQIMFEELNQSFSYEEFTLFR